MPINCLMYHYVRNNEEHWYDTHCRRKDEFQSQVNFFNKNFDIVNPKDIEKFNYYLQNEEKDGYIFTFDDGYKDHLFCAEYLESHNLSGYFFPVKSSVFGKLLDVNLIHFLIGSREISTEDIFRLLFEICKDEKIEIQYENKILHIDNYIKIFAEEDRFEVKKINLIKRLLQRDIKNNLVRENLCKRLSDNLLKKDIKKLAKELYLDKSDLIKMKHLGMSFGGHGINHNWMSTLSFEEKEKEIKDSISSLKNIGLIDNDEKIAYCYPYGNYDPETLSIASSLNISYGFTTEVGFAYSTKVNDALYEIPRWDTNDCWDKYWNKPKKPCI